MKEYYTVACESAAELTIKKSQFLSVITPVFSEKEANQQLQTRRQKHRTARHHVWALRLREGSFERCSDDGEPQGTGGHPVLQLLQTKELWDVLVVVTRYFGGILLGTGGLQRAYSDAAGLAIASAKFQKQEFCVELELCCDYAFFSKLQKSFELHRAVVLKKRFEQEVCLQIRLPAEEQERFLASARELTNGTLRSIQLRAHDSAL